MGTPGEETRVSRKKSHGDTSVESPSVPSIPSYVHARAFCHCASKARGWTQPPVSISVSTNEAMAIVLLVTRMTTNCPTLREGVSANPKIEIKAVMIHIMTLVKRK
jgi:hypothetical protein